MIAERLGKIKSLRHQKEVIVREERLSSEPLNDDVDKIPCYYERFNGIASPSNKDNVKIFVYLIYFIYSPASCIGRGLRGPVRRKVAEVLNISCSAVSMQFSYAKVLFDKHRGFRAETEKIYDRLVSEEADVDT